MLKHSFSPLSKSSSKAPNSTDEINTKWHQNQSDDDDDDENDQKNSSTMCGSKQYKSKSSKISRRRPPSGTDNAVRRWNSFHSTRNECHPNKFRRERKSTSPSIELGRRHFAFPPRKYELQIGKSQIAEKSTNEFTQTLLLGSSSYNDHGSSSIW